MARCVPLSAPSAGAGCHGRGTWAAVGQCPRRRLQRGVEGGGGLGAGIRWALLFVFVEVRAVSVFIAPWGGVSGWGQRLRGVTSCCLFVAFLNVSCLTLALRRLVLPGAVVLLQGAPEGWFGRQSLSWGLWRRPQELLLLRTLLSLARAGAVFSWARGRVQGGQGSVLDDRVLQERGTQSLQVAPYHLPWVASLLVHLSPHIIA